LGPVDPGGAAFAKILVGKLCSAACQSRTKTFRRLEESTRKVANDENGVRIMGTNSGANGSTLAGTGGHRHHDKLPILRPSYEARLGGLGLF
jgi:hypothetical protein